MRFPLYSKVLAWLILNVLIGFLAAYAFSARNASSGLDVLLTQAVRERVITIARPVAEEAARVDGAERAKALQRASAQYGVVFSLTRSAPDNAALRSERTHKAFLPAAMMDERINISRTHHPSGYDVATKSMVNLVPGIPLRVMVTAHVQDFSELLRFLGLGHALASVGLIFLITALWWWPFVWNLSHALMEVRSATQQMSRGHLQTRVAIARRDEIGELGIAVNAMAQRLESYVQGQRQFVADIAHEVTSPVARMQICLAIMAQRVGPEGTQAIADLREDLEQMAEMLNELLLFSRSGLEAARTTPRPVELASAVNSVVRAECTENAVSIKVPIGLAVVVHAALFQRALANLLRNAQRYAGNAATPIEVIARDTGGRVTMSVQDRGPGVPESALSRLGEPFFRPELSRSRLTGGFGLGLAIVRRCIEACGGEVIFRNRPGGGFQAELDLPQA